MTPRRVPRGLAAGLALLAVASALLIAATPARASVDVSIQGYTSGGGFTPVGSGGSIPTGATLEIKVWKDLYSCDPVTVRWGDGAQETRSYSSFAATFTHTYNTPGTYTITASDGCGAGKSGTINVGGAGGLSLLDPSSDTFMPTLFGLFLAIFGIALAFGGAKPPAAAPPPAPPANPARPRRPFVPGVLPSMAMHLVWHRDIPPGAPVQADPRIPMLPGQATDVLQRIACPACGGPLGYVAEGWFCLNPGCPLIRRP